jgi:hypothetical protein
VLDHDFAAFGPDGQDLTAQLVLTRGRVVGAAARAGGQ